MIERMFRLKTRLIVICQTRSERFPRRRVGIILCSRWKKQRENIRNLFTLPLVTINKRNEIFTRTTSKS